MGVFFEKNNATQLSDDDVIIVAGAVRAALKEFTDLGIDLKILAAQVLLQWVESSNTDPES